MAIPIKENSKRKRKRTNPPPPPTELLESITIELENGLEVTGTYISPTTKTPTVEKFLTETLSEFGLKQIIIGDLNARHSTWDKRGNERGVAVHKVVQKNERTYMAAADVPSYFKVIKNKNKKEGTTRFVECSSDPDICISRIQNTVAIIEDKRWGQISDHRPLIVKISSQLTIRDVRKRVAKVLFHSPTTISEIADRYKDEIPILINRLRTIQQDTDENTVRQLHASIQHGITEPWEKKIISRPPGKPVWWHAALGTAQHKRSKAAKKWHQAVDRTKGWSDNILDKAATRAHEDLKKHKKTVFQMSRRAKAKFEASAKQRLQEAGITEQSRAVCKDKRGKALRQAEVERRGKQLLPADFTKFMGSQQGGGDTITLKRFKVDSRKFRRRLKRALNVIAKNKAVGNDNIHAEMMQIAPDLFLTTNLVVDCDWKYRHNNT